MRERVARIAGLTYLFEQWETLLPPVYQTLIAATEYVSSWLFSKRRQSAAVEMVREVMLRVVLHTLLELPGIRRLPPRIDD